MSLKKIITRLSSSLSFDKKIKSFDTYSKKERKNIAKKIFRFRRSSKQIGILFLLWSIISIILLIISYMFYFVGTEKYFLPLYLQISLALGSVIPFLLVLLLSPIFGSSFVEYDSVIKRILCYEKKTGEKIIPDKYRSDAEKISEKIEWRS